MDLSVKNTNNIYLKKANNFLAKYISLFSNIVILILLILGVAFFLWPKYERIRQGTEQAISEKKIENSKSVELLSKINTYITNYNNISAKDKENINIILPDNANDENLYAQMERIAKEEGVILTSMKIDQSSTQEESNIAQKSMNVVEHSGKKVKNVDIEISVLGVDYKKTKKLLTRFENNMRLMDVSEVSFSLNGQLANFKISTYYYQ
jgi:hypothetical protein